eukprot:CAMPEP_0118700100 /NCGR_PEP_ID=MMETSP0800-20121206/16356_1 /TAXON_ID=210618 ORGANISM="Striatella unipunctata, Strain CCMP2910" /NCGR_SAMPLE_ID=MMETSP0800 /ASSEMBLY_ACC=CAM_ASM_000638 /LENGTH=390 /DNA_ID=CAMNT_0006600569 /DNA_START=182 /DNA_END=1355 /DNA_ORIENTATION=-
MWSTHGFLSIYSSNPLWGSGAIDFAGSGVVHITGGATALFATIVLGPRRGRFHDAAGAKLDKANLMPGHSVALQVLGTLILWFGWFGFNAGSALTVKSLNESIAALCAATTAISGAAGGVSALVVNLFWVETQTGEATFDIVMLMNGALCGLVAITSGCAVVDPWAAFLIGMMAGLVYISASKLLVRLSIDDAVDAIPVHLAGGIWGMIATGLFSKPANMELVYGDFNHAGWFYTPKDATLLGAQIFAITFIGVTIAFTMLPFFVLLNYLGWLRVDSIAELVDKIDSIAELVGLDISYHGGHTRNEVDESGEPRTTRSRIQKLAKKPSQQLASQLSSQSQRLVMPQRSNYEDSTTWGDPPSQQESAQSYDPAITTEAEYSVIPTNHQFRQ